MDSSLSELVDQIREKFFAFEPASPADLAAAAERGVPESLLEFYAIADGAFLGSEDYFPAPDGKHYRLEFVQLAELQTTQEFGYVDDDAPHFNDTARWWQIIDYGDANWLAVDATDDGADRILDVFHETVGYEEEQAVVALSLSEMLTRILAHKDIYWFDEDFEPYARI